jgi:hypothetical protein
VNKPYYVISTPSRGVLHATDVQKAYTDDAGALYCFTQREDGSSAIARIFTAGEWLWAERIEPKSESDPEPLSSRERQEHWERWRRRFEAKEEPTFEQVQKKRKTAAEEALLETVESLCKLLFGKKWRIAALLLFWGSWHKGTLQEQVRRLWTACHEGRDKLEPFRHV